MPEIFQRFDLSLENLDYLVWLNGFLYYFELLYSDNSPELEPMPAKIHTIAPKLPSSTLKTITDCKINHTKQ
jgi:hypothetical protein